MSKKFKFYNLELSQSELDLVRSLANDYYRETGSTVSESYVHAVLSLLNGKRLLLLDEVDYYPSGNKKPKRPV